MHSKSWIIFIVVVLAVGFQFSMFGDEEITDKQYESYVKEFANSFGEQMETEFNLHLVKPGGAFYDYLKEGMEFYAFRRATLEEARALEVAVMGKLAEAIRANQNLIPYFKENKVSIIFREEKFFVGSVPFYDGTIESVVLDNNELTYSHYIPDLDRYDYHDKVTYAKESYQEAQEALEIPSSMKDKISEGMLSLNYWFRSLFQFGMLIFALFIFSGLWVLLIPVVLCFLIYIMRKNS